MFWEFSIIWVRAKIRVRGAEFSCPRGRPRSPLWYTTFRFFSDVSVVFFKLLFSYYFVFVI
jgi:hypothetical protein